MTNEKAPVLGIDVGGTKVAVCLADQKGNVLGAARVAGGTRRTYSEVLPDLLGLCRKIVNDAGFGLDEVACCGLATPGPINLDRGSILKSPNMVWGEVMIRDDVTAGLGIPTVMQNDANAGILAEWFFGAARGCHNAIYFTMSTGIGGGIIAEDRLVTGAGGNAGEVGHAVLDVNGPVCGCGMRGCFEAFCGGRNVALRLQRIASEQPDNPLMKLPAVAGDREKLSFEVLRDAVEQGVPFALEFWDDFCLRMAQGLGVYIMTFNPQMVILGTMFLYSGETLMRPVMHYLPRFTWPVILKDARFELPGLGKRIGELAGISVGLYELYKREEWTPPPRERGGE